jgi:hypothetical protein
VVEQLNECLSELRIVAYVLPFHYLTPAVKLADELTRPEAT